MTESEEATSGTTVDHTETSTEYDKGEKRISSSQGGRGDRENAGKNPETPRQALIRITRVKLGYLELCSC